MTQDLNLGLGDRAERVLYQAAATGDLMAQRHLARAAIDARDRAAARGDDTTTLTIEGIFWARLAGAHGEGSDGLNLSEALAHGGNWLSRLGLADAADHLAGESLAVLRMLGAAGNTEALGAMRQVLADLPPNVISISTQLVEAANAPINPAH
jgi:hypothetical protein